MRNIASASGQADELVGLQAEAPARMREAIGCRLCDIGVLRRPVHRLQEEMPEGKPREAFRVEALLREDQLQFVAGCQRQRRIRLWADADPVEARWRRDRAIGLDRAGETVRMQGRNQGFVEL